MSVKNRTLQASTGKLLPVIDAKRAMKLHVGERELAKANRKAPNSCALAEACMKKEGVKEVRIHLSRAYVRTDDKKWNRFLVSRALRTEIVAFDRGGKFAPGDYTLTRISPSTRFGAEKRKNRTSPKKNGKPRKHRNLVDVRLGPA